MEYQNFLLETFFHFLNKFHYLFIIMEKKSNENLMENQKNATIPLKTKRYFH